MNWKTSKYRKRFRLGTNLFWVTLLLSMWFFSSFIVAVNFDLTFPSDGQMLFVAALTGVYLSRWVTAALLIVLLPGSLLYRTVLATLLFGGEAVLAAITYGRTEPVIAFLAIPFTIIAFAIPFEVARVIWDARLDVDWFDFSQRRQLGIASLMMRVTVAAMLLGVLRLCEIDIALDLLALTLVLSLFGAIVLLPFTIKVMAGRYRFLSFLASVLLAVLVSLSGVFLVEQFNNPLNTLQRSAVPAGLAMFLTFYGLALLVLSRLGMRLQFGATTDTSK